MTVSALDPGDSRSVETEVAGPAALLVAKAHKLHDRLESGRADRVDDKDAADVVRLMQTTSPAEVGATLAMLCQDTIAGQPSTDALTYVEELFGRRSRTGIEMASRALRLGMPAPRIETLCVAYTTQLLQSARQEE